MMSRERQKIADFFSNDGALSRTIEGYRPRAEQIEMAQAIGDALADEETLIVEAGTGTGKTFAYLLPILMFEGRAIVSTGTKHLQDQLFEKDIPLLEEATDRPIKSALLKGRSNYLCHYRLRTVTQRGRLENKRQVDQVKALVQFQKSSKTGDLSQLDSPLDSTLQSNVTATSENCLGKECPDYDSCFFFAARDRAKEAEIIVVNHHLLCADLALKEGGFGEILPTVDSVIVDEAHQLAEITSYFFSDQVGSRQILLWIDDFERAIREEAPDFKDHDPLILPLNEALSALRNLFPKEAKRSAMSDYLDNRLIQDKMLEIGELLQALLSIITPLEKRAQLFIKMISRLTEMTQSWLMILKSEGKEPNHIRWMETFAVNFTFHATPLKIADIFQQQTSRLAPTWIYTSATLAVGEDFSYFATPLGISQKRTLKLESPFDFPRTSLLYHPPNLPPPHSEEFLPQFIEAVIPVIEAADGRTFLLFTSYRALNSAYTLLKDRVEYPLFKQGDRSKMALIEDFKASGNGILLGTMSFWEGVDVKGEALTCVVIEKFPFASPGDPVEQAKINLINEGGGNAFMHYQLPRAVIALKQGVGRLIRDHDDYGVLVLADPRLMSKSYGKIFIESLPDMTKTLKIERVHNFYRYIEERNRTRASIDE